MSKQKKVCFIMFLILAVGGFFLRFVDIAEDEAG